MRSIINSTFYLKNGRLLERLIVGLVSIVLITCNLIRIFRVPMTVDESPSRSDLWLSYWDYVRLTKVTANIHILNSILRKVCIDLFGNTPFTLRLPVFLAHIVFIVFAYLLVSKLFRQGLWRVCVFLLLNLNPFVFQFWGYSRGYGLGLAFMVVGTYSLVCFVEKQNAQQAWSAMVFAALAVWSNFSQLNFYLALLCAFAVLFLYSNEKLSYLRKTAPAILTVSLILAALIFDPIRKLSLQGELYYGGESGLFQDTVSSLIRETLFVPYMYGREMALAVTVSILTAASFCFWAVMLIRQRENPRTQVGVVLTLLLLVPLCSVELQFLLLNTRFLIDRTAMFLIVLFLINVSYSIYCATSRVRYVGVGLIAAITGIYCWNFSEHFNLNKSRNWWLDNYNLMVLERLAPRAKAVGHPLKIRCSWIQMPSMDYYVYTRFPDQFEELIYEKNAPGPADTVFDYIYLPMDEARGISEKYTLDTSYEETCVLYKKK